MSDIVAELDDIAEFCDELAMQIKRGNALHPDDVAGERQYAIGVIDTLRRMERHVLSAYQLALEIALREQS